MRPLPLAVLLATGALTGCDPEDELLTVMAQTPTSLDEPEVSAFIDSSDRLRWEATGLPSVAQDQVYVMWLAPADWMTDAEWQALGTIARQPDGSASGWFEAGPETVPDFHEVTRPLAISIETLDQIDTTPSVRCVMWTSRFPSDGLVQTFAYGDPLRALRLQDLIAADGDLTGPHRAFSRFEISYQKDEVFYRVWNLQTPQPGYKYVLWVRGANETIKMHEMTELPSLEPTRPSQVPATGLTPSEYAVEMAYDPRVIPYSELVGVSVTYELTVPATGHGHGLHPEGIEVLRGDALSHDSELSDYNVSHHGGGDEEGGGGGHH